MADRVLVDYFIAGKYLGRANLLYDKEFGPENLMFVCPVCGDPWARIIVEGSQQWRVITRSCGKHKAQEDRLGLPGSILSTNFDPEFCINRYSPCALHKLPIEIVRYEFNLTMSMLGD